MTRIHHLHCGSLQPAGGGTAICHCLLLEDANGLAAVDTGIGLHDEHTLNPQLIEAAGFLFDGELTLAGQLARRGFDRGSVNHAVLTHCDPDHTGGLADHPSLQVHVAEEEYTNLATGNARYVREQLAHGPRWKTYAAATRRWFGLEARPVDLGFASEILLIPLFGHTSGHCGVAIQQEDRWVLHVGDAYYLRVELASDDHPVSQLAAQRADSDAQRRASLTQLRRLANEHPQEIEMFGYHDPGEYFNRYS